MRVKMFISVFLLLSSVFLFGCVNDVDFQDEEFCSGLDLTVCNEYSDLCQMCGDRVTSSSLDCHSKEFCSNARLIFE